MSQDEGEKFEETKQMEYVTSSWCSRDRRVKSEESRVEGRKEHTGVEQKIWSSRPENKSIMVNVLGKLNCLFKESLIWLGYMLDFLSVVGTVRWVVFCLDPSFHWKGSDTTYVSHFWIRVSDNDET